MKIKYFLLVIDNIVLLPTFFAGSLFHNESASINGEVTDKSTNPSFCSIVPLMMD